MVFQCFFAWHVKSCILADLAPLHQGIDLSSYKYLLTDPNVCQGDIYEYITSFATVHTSSHHKVIKMISYEAYFNTFTRQVHFGNELQLISPCHNNLQTIFGLALSKGTLASSKANFHAQITGYPVSTKHLNTFSFIVWQS